MPGLAESNYPNIERMAVASNGEAARLAGEDSTMAAIASEIAGQKYKLQVVKAHVQDDPHNRTRFAVIGRLLTTPSGKDQTSLVLSVQNKAGAVYNLLAPLAKHGVSMTRFESRPARMGTWEYYFYVDVEGHLKDRKVADALRRVERQCRFLQGAGILSFQSSL
jgi:chorismate mutase/prephenate dehydratase